LRENSITFCFGLSDYKGSLAGIDIQDDEGASLQRFGLSISLIRLKTVVTFMGLTEF